MSKKKTKNYKRFKERLRNNASCCKSAQKKLDGLKIKDIKIPGIKFAVNEDIRQCMGEKEYFVTNYGQLFHKYDNGKIKACKITFLQPNPKIDKKYGQVYLGGRTDYIHRVVAETWCEGFDPILRNEVHHIDHDPSNNYYKNLKWVNKIHHSHLDRDVEIYFMHNRRNSDFQDVSDLVEICNQMRLDIEYVGKKLKKKPDFYTNDLDMYEFDVGTEFPYIIALKRNRKVA